jgi:molybdopterin-guanine dinucleotide biosynthesis protein A
MGTDKAFVTVDGVAMARRVATALRAGGAASVVCVGGDRAGLRRLGLPSIEDEWPGEGPLGGLVTALGWAHEAGRETLLLAGCDQPWLDAEAVRGLVEAHAKAASAVTLYRVDTTVQPLPGVYEVALRRELEVAMANGERALGSVFGMAEATVLQATHPATLRDVDRPEDLPSA